MINYQFGAKFAEGSYGELFDLTETDSGWQGVAKVLKSHMGDEERARFQREVRLQAQLSHPNVMTIRATGLDADPPWFAMDRAKHNLRNEIELRGFGEHLLTRFTEAARGVEYAHGNGIIHRDIKPENILVFETNSGESAVVADFGLGKHIDAATLSLTVSNFFLGTVAYAAPEQIDAKHVDARVDVYALGKILSEILTGRLPYPSVRLDGIEGKFAFIIQRATADNPDRRYQTVTQLLEDLELVTTKRDQLERPQERVEEILDLYRLTSLVVRTEDAEELMRILRANDREYTLMISAIPRMPEQIITYFESHHIDNFIALMQSYEMLLNSEITFTYCDVVANFYERLFELVVDRRVREIVLIRLSTLGYKNNRWHVGRVFGRLVSQLVDPGLLVAFRDYLVSRPDAAAWDREYVSNIPAILRPVFSPV